jgi:hypothetical protein
VVPAGAARGEAPEVRVSRVPEAGLQPLAAVGSDGTLHLIYFKGDARAGDLLYVRREKGAADFGAPVRVNSESGSAAALGTIRGGQMALGKDDRIHVVWNGSGRKADGTTDHEHCPVMYSRWDAAKKAFEPARNLMTCTMLLDGGCTVAADREGRVTAAWHAVSATSKERTEAERRVYVAVSEDEGKTFGVEAPVAGDAGVCACCGMTALAEACGRVDVLFRGAASGSERGMVLLRGECAGEGQGASFTRTALQEWRIQACPMSSAGIATQASSFGAIDPRLAWETEGQVWLATLSSIEGKVSTPVAPPGEGGKRKHPRVAVNRKGETLMVWTEGTGWSKGGAVAWQVFDARNKPIDGASGRRDGVPVWSFGAAVALPDGGFEVLY